MRTLLVSLALAASAAAYGADDAYFTVICTAHLVHRETGRIDMEYDRMRGGSTLDEARELAEDNAMEICAMDAFRFDYQDSHECRLVSCDQ